MSGKLELARDRMSSSTELSTIPRAITKTRLHVAALADACFVQGSLFFIQRVPFSRHLTALEERPWEQLAISIS